MMRLFDAAGIKVRDVSKDKEWQFKGIDFVSTDGVTYDVKYDTRAAETGNIAVELVSKKVNGVVEQEGWLYTSDADFIVYVYQWFGSWVAKLFTIPDLRQLSEGVPTRPVRNRTYEGLVALVPVNTTGKVPEVSFPIVSEDIDTRVLENVHKEVAVERRNGINERR